MEIRTIGLYTIETYYTPVFGACINYYKGGHLLGHYSDLTGKRLLYKFHADAPKLTRAQGFRYWRKHFSQRLVWLLPELLQAAIETTTYNY